MNKKFVLIATLSALLLTSCSFFKLFSIDSEEKKAGVYVLDTIAYDTNPQMSDAYIGDLTLRFKEGEKYIPYISLKQYASIFSKFLNKKAVSEVTTEGLISSWSIKMDNDLYFYAAISPLEKLVLVAGDLTSVLNSGEGGIQPTYDVLNYGAQSNTTYDQLTDTNYATYTFEDCDFDYFRNGGEVYMPLGLYDLALCEASTLYITYNYKNIFCSTNPDDFSQLAFRDGFSYSTVDDQMVRAASNGSMPQYLINYNASCFLFVMQNFYGLRDHFSIENMKEYYKKNGLYDNFYSSSAQTRALAFSKAINIFDDNHSVLLSTNTAWGENARAPYGKGIQARNALEKRLSTLRKEKYQAALGVNEPQEGNVIYSDDRKTAMFYFDSFKYGTEQEVFDNYGRVRDTAYKYDTFILFRKVLAELNQVSTVENVIIDVSLNGGGTLGVLIKLLPLLSKNNYAAVDFYDSSCKVAYTYACKSDADGDNDFDQDDCYGNRFNFYILSSDCAFSCGNAFPCYAQQLGVKIIGETSGGGECAVSIHYLPNSQYIYHSSNLHIGAYDKTTKKFTGFEDGATPDIPLNENNAPMCTVNDNGDPIYNIPHGFYDINALSEKLA